MMAADLEQLRAYIDFFRDLGIHDFYRRGEIAPEGEFARQVAKAAASRRPGSTATSVPVVTRTPGAPAAKAAGAESRVTQASAGAPLRSKPAPLQNASAAQAVTPIVSVPSVERQALEAPIGKLISFEELRPLPERRLAAGERAAALVALRAQIGDCTRCPLAYAGRHTIVFGEGDPSARLMFVGEGPGADEDTTGRPFVGKAGQLLNNMIAAMGLQREQVYIANIVKCRPPGNRVPEPVEANTCTPFLAEQIDIVQPEVIVALGATAAMYLLGVRASLGSLRGHWHMVRGAKAAVTYHPAFLLRDPRQKGEAWKDLQRVMTELKLKAAPAKG